MAADRNKKTRILNVTILNVILCFIFIALFLVRHMPMNWPYALHVYGATGANPITDEINWI